MGGIQKAICRSPYFKRTGQTLVQLTIIQSKVSNTSIYSNVTFTGPLTVINDEPNLQVYYQRFTTYVSLVFTWSPSLFTDTGVNSTVRSVAIRMITFNASSGDWIDALIVASNVSNTYGRATITLDFGTVPWLIAQELVSKSFVAFRIDVSDPSSLNGLSNVYAFKTGTYYN